MDNIAMQVISWDAIKVWLPCLVSIVTLMVNMLFYIFVQPRVTMKASRKERMANIADEFLEYLSSLPSETNFNGAPTQIRNYSLKIHLCFKSGTAPKKLSDDMEEIFQAVLKRKTLGRDDVARWNEEIRVKSRRLRKKLAKYCGVL